MLRRRIPGASAEFAQLFLGGSVFAGTQARFIEMDDASRSARQAWLQQIMVVSEPLNFSDAPEALLSRAISDFDVFVLGGDDAEALGDFMAQNQSVLLGKAKICVCTASTAADRVRLLDAGFDIVVDIACMSQLELIARLFAILERYRNAPIQHRYGTDFDAMIGLVAYTQKLSPKQRVVIRALLQHPGYTASYQALCFAAGNREAPIGLQNLKVLISQIRKHLRSGFYISHHFNSAYKMIGPGL